MTPLLVRAWLSTATHVPEPLHLDALLEEAVARRVGSEVTRATPADRIRPLAIPLARAEYEGARVWLASAHIAEEPAVPDLLVQTRRRAPDDWDWYDRPVSVAAGPAKDVMVRRQCVLTPTLRWYCVGHRSEVVDLLRSLWGAQDAPRGAIGSARRGGLGVIARWSVDAADHQPEDCIIRDGLAVRHIPQQWVERAEWWRSGAWRGPYWHPGRQERVPRIGTRVRLKPGAHHALQRAVDAAA